MQIRDNAAASLASHPVSSGVAGRNDGPSFQDVLAQLNDYTGSNPGQGMFNSILAQLGITPQEYAQMTPQERAKIEEKIHELMKKEMQAQMQQQNQSMQLTQMQQTGTQTGTQSDTSSHKRGTIDFAV
ncbi:hypothetical protein [Paraburkholderia rhizosphaerae]|uniref:Uncharacterized protein n=1 Tax=Paraburkholderia rhizosphaerae TaxID=480658 RepID=A0A4R8LXW0_9BURK|nr:hypothetical protein [Paraburkholderia rhizosphaerae]TDY52775.1 hypothetical protein BX592_10457 [Paraburkholderia rhizosphaerae]